MGSLTPKSEFFVGVECAERGSLDPADGISHLSMM